MKENRSKLRLAGLSAILMLGVVTAACSAEPAASADAEVVETVTPVRVATVEQGALSVRNEIIGLTTPYKTVDVIPKLGGELASVNVSKGDVVEAGDTLGVIDTSDLRVQIELSQATLAQAQTQLKNAQLGLEQAENSITKKVLTESGFVSVEEVVSESDDTADTATEPSEDADGDIEASSAGSESVDTEQDTAVATDGTEAVTETPQGVNRTDLELQNIRLQLEQAETNLQRMEALYAEGLISEQQYEQAVAGAEQARIAYQQVLLATQDVDYSVDQAELGVEQAQIQVNQANINLNQARKQLADATIVAPISGQIVNVNADPGELVSMQMPFVTIIATDPIIVTADVNVRQLLMLQEQEQVEVEIPDLGQTVMATITYISPTTNQTGFYTIEAQLDNPDQKIRAGMMSKIRIDQQLVEQAVLVPTAAVIEQAGESYIYVVKNDRAVRVDVEIIEAQTDITAISGDVSAGDQIVVSGQMTLSPDTKVRIIDGEARSN